MKTRFSSPRLRASAALIALAVGLAACADETPQAPENENSAVVTELAPPAPEPAELPAPIEEEAAPADNIAAAPPPVGVEEEPVSIDQQTLEDADATGMTSRYAGEEASQEASAGEETAPAE